MTRTRFNLADNPELKRVVRAAFPSYKKREAVLAVFHEMNINSYWNGGSRDEYAAVDLVTLRPKALPSSTHPYFDVARYGVRGENDMVSVSDRGNITLKLLPANVALVQAGTFCGKQATATVYVNESNMPRLLPAASEVSHG